MIYVWDFQISPLYQSHLIIEAESEHEARKIALECAERFDKWDLSKSYQDDVFEKIKDKPDYDAKKALIIIHSF